LSIKTRQRFSPPAGRSSDSYAGGFELRNAVLPSQGAHSGRQFRATGTNQNRGSPLPDSAQATGKRYPSEQIRTDDSRFRDSGRGSGSASAGYRWRKPERTTTKARKRKLAIANHIGRIAGPQPETEEEIFFVLQKTSGRPRWLTGEMDRQRTRPRTGGKKGPEHGYRRSPGALSYVLPLGKKRLNKGGFGK
jgi:hypothetical protein